MVPPIELVFKANLVNAVKDTMLDGIDPVINLLERIIDVTFDPLHVTPIHGVHTGVSGTPSEHLQALKLFKVPMLVEDIISQKKLL